MTDQFIELLGFKVFPFLKLLELQTTNTA